MSASASATAPQESEASIETPPVIETATSLFKSAKKKLSKAKRAAKAVDSEETHTGVKDANPAGNEDPPQPLPVPVRTHRSDFVLTTNPLRHASITQTGQQFRERLITGQDTSLAGIPGPSESSHIPAGTRPHVPGISEAKQDQVFGANLVPIGPPSDPPGSNSGQGRSRSDNLSRHCFKCRYEYATDRRSDSEVSALRQSTINQILQTVIALAAVQEATNRRLLLVEQSGRQNHRMRDISVPSIEQPTNRRFSPDNLADIRNTTFYSLLLDFEALVISRANQDGAPFAETTRDHVTDKCTFRFHSDVPPPRGDTVFTVQTDSGSFQAHAQKSQHTETIAKLNGGDFDTHRFWN